MISLFIRLLLIILMAAYSFSIEAEIIKVKKCIQPIDKKEPKKSKSQKANEAEDDREQPCEKVEKLCKR